MIRSKSKQINSSYKLIIIVWRTGSFSITIHIRTVMCRLILILFTVCALQLIQAYQTVQSILIRLQFRLFEPNPVGINEVIIEWLGRLLLEIRFGAAVKELK